MNWLEFLDDDISEDYSSQPDKSIEALLLQLIREVKLLHSVMHDVSSDIEAIRSNTR